MAEVATKRCTTCGEEKPLTEFNRQSKARGGRAAACRKCTNLRKRQATMIAADPQCIASVNRVVYEAPDPQPAIRVGRRAPPPACPP